MRSANLVIMITDIAGYTATTARHTRAQNERLISTHNTILLPLVISFGGRHIKSIGDSLLVIFESPTDALLCAMAMQDSLFIHNKEVSFDAKLQIRIALNLGEVRLSENDVFGDPVNMTSRIEGITPPGEIYFSESVYITMNRAEVSAELVGEKRFSGAAESVKIYRVPSFTTRILESSSITERNEFDSTLPFGGLHLREIKPLASDASVLLRNVLAISSILMVLLAIGLASFSYLKRSNIQASTNSTSQSLETVKSKIDSSPAPILAPQLQPQRYNQNETTTFHQPDIQRNIQSWNQPGFNHANQRENRMIKPPFIRPQDKPIRSFRDRPKP